MALRARAQDLQKKIGAEALPHLNPSAGKEMLIEFIIDVQVSMMRSGLGMRVSPQFFGAPHDFQNDDDEGYFGGDGYLARKDMELATKEFNVPLAKVQPNHRGLSFEDNVQVNLEEAHNAFQRSKARNQGSIMLG